MGPDAAALAALRADWHGAPLRVVAAANAALVGVEGIVVAENAHTMKLVAEDARVRTIPRRGCVFSIELGGGRSLAVVGERLGSGRAAERIVRKFKAV